jgi:hypothetical protein
MLHKVINMLFQHVSMMMVVVAVKDEVGRAMKADIIFG